MLTRRPAGTARVLTTVVLMTTLATGGIPVARAVTGTTAGRPAAAQVADPIAHDPSMIKAGGFYYVFISGDSGVPHTYLPVKRSSDLLHWEELGPVFSAPPQWIVDTLGSTPADFWAPDINYFNGSYHLYYAASQFGVNNSVIGLATNVTLDPASPDYHWVDEGLVLRSQPGDSFNAIDPDLSFDASGTPWLSFGSFWSGIVMRRLDAATGRPDSTDQTLYPLVDRHWAPNAVEAPSIVRHGDFFYLFASFDYCCRGKNSEYRVVVGRASQITGPYVDESGLALLSGGGTELLRGYNTFAGPGGGDVYVDGERTLFVHHYYDVADSGRPKLSVRQVDWRDGWPTLADPLSGNRGAGHGGAYFQLIEKTSGAVIATPPAGPQAPMCGYEGANIQLAAAAASPCQQWRFEGAGDGYLGIRNRHSNKVFDAAFCGYADGTNIGQWGWLDNDCQKFRLVPTADGWARLQNKNEPGGQPGKFVDSGPGCDDGTNVQLWSPAEQRCQQFRLQPVGDVLLVSAESGQPLGAAHCTTPGDSVVGPTDATATSCAHWQFVHTSDGYYSIVNAGSRKQLISKHCGTSSAVVAGNPADGAACTQWRIDSLNDGSFRLIDRADQTVLTVSGCGRDSEPALRREPWTGSDCQRFSIVLP